MPVPAGEPSHLALARRPASRWLLLPGLLVLAGGAAWWMTHPAPLPVDQPPVSASTRVTVPVYVGVLSTDSERTLELSAVTVPVLEDPGSGKVVPLICRGGSISQTTDPTPFCPEVLAAPGETLHLGDGDQLMVRLQSHTAGLLRVGPLLVTYRDGLQSATQPTGPTISVDVLPRGSGQD